MTNYERIQHDKAFCAWVVMEARGDFTFEEAIEWLDERNLRELTDEREHKEDL